MENYYLYDGLLAIRERLNNRMTKFNEKKLKTQSNNCKRVEIFQLNLMSITIGFYDLTESIKSPK